MISLGLLIAMTMLVAVSVILYIRSRRRTILPYDAREHWGIQISFEDARAEYSPLEHAETRTGDQWRSLLIRRVEGDELWTFDSGARAGLLLVRRGREIARVNLMYRSYGSRGSIPPSEGSEPCAEDGNTASVSLCEVKRLGNGPSLEDVFARVPITFFTVLVKREALPSEGLPVEESHRSTKKLAAFVFMEATYAESLLGMLEAHGAVLGKHIGVADMMHGPMVECDGIQYVWDEESLPPSWTAFRIPDGSPDNVSGSPSL